MQTAKPSDSAVACPNGHKPSHVFRNDAKWHQIECCRCSMRTPRMPTLEAAEKAWAGMVSLTKGAMAA